MSRFLALLDASALYSIRVTSLALEVAAAGIYQPKWSHDIQEEWKAALLRKNPKTDPKKIARRMEYMNQAFPDALIAGGYEKLVNGLKLPDENDRHVLAAAIRGRCDVIVTFNMKHFPIEALEEHGIEAQHPDEFLLHQMTLNPPLFVNSAKEVFQRLKNPPHPVGEFLDSLRRAGLPLVADALVEHAELLKK